MKQLNHESTQVLCKTYMYMNGCSNKTSMLQSTVSFHVKYNILKFNQSVQGFVFPLSNTSWNIYKVEVWINTSSWLHQVTINANISGFKGLLHKMFSANTTLYQTNMLRVTQINIVQSSQLSQLIKIQMPDRNQYQNHQYPCNKFFGPSDKQSSHTNIKL